jgi:hypothetical protein
LLQAEGTVTSIQGQKFSRVFGRHRAKILEKGEMVPGHLASPNLIGARITGTDPKVMAAVIRGALMESLPA